MPRSSLGKPTPDERFVSWGSLASAFALSWLITQRLLPMAGLPWLLIGWFVFSLLIGGLTGGMRGGWPEVAEVVAKRAILWGAGLVFAALVSTIVFVVLKGWHPVTHLNFFTDDMAGVGPNDGLDRGGLIHAVVGTLIELSIALAITLPLGIGTAVFMNEVGGRFARIVRTVVEAMTALPSIVAGLFVLSLFILLLGFPRSGLAAGLALAVMMLPIIARASDVVLRVVPGGLREASFALGASRWKTVWHVVLPTAKSGLATAVILGVARGVGETSPVLLTSGYATFMVKNPTDGVMDSLPLNTFVQVRSGIPSLVERGYGSALVLITLVLTLFVIARLLARPRSNKVKRHRLRSLVRRTFALNRASK